jgi:asparagine synthase (glutamine-hydrolysing)
MCGICGILHLERELSVDPVLISAMCNRMLHRGPDDEGAFVEGPIGLGVRRLAIIDLSTGNQPIHNEDRTIWIVFNGAIYNYRELRADLEAHGHRFYTATDTEVIVHAYESFGDDCVQHLNGMFAFALWDRRKGRLFIARDRLGIKPLCYALVDNRLIFGSEIKAVLAAGDIPREVDLFALDQYFALRYIPAPYTIWRAVRKLPPGHRLVYETGQVQITRYWDLQFVPDETVDEDTWAEGLRERLATAVQRRLVSDVPLGAFLSGGLDSSTVVSLMARAGVHPIRTFSVGFKEHSYNELPYARLVAERFGTEHHELIVEPNAIDLVPRLTRQFDEPFADVSVLPTYLVSEFTHQHVTVALSGDGGDELFGGYDWYTADAWAQWVSWVPAGLWQAIAMLTTQIPPNRHKKGLINKARRFLEGMALPADLGHIRWMVAFGPRGRARLYRPEIWRQLNGSDPFVVVRKVLARAQHLDLLNRGSWVDLHTWIPYDGLPKVDIMTAFCSLEARVPFLDHEVVEYVATMPSHIKKRGREAKYILKRAMTGIVPDVILQRREKQGFSMPVKTWLKEDLHDMVNDLLNDTRVAQGGYFRVEEVHRLREGHLSGRHDHTHRLWELLVFELWRMSRPNVSSQVI